MYPDERVARFVSDELIPVRAHVEEQPEVFERFGAQWTPTLLIVDPDEQERHRFEGFLPAEELLGQLRLGLAHAAKARGDWRQAERRYRELADDETAGEAAPEAQYWAGVARYKLEDDPDALSETAAAFRERYTDSPWAKKASVWAE